MINQSGRLERKECEDGYCNEPNSTENDINEVAKVLTSLGLGVHISKGSERTIIGVIGDKRKLSDVPLELMNGVEKLIPIVESYKLASKLLSRNPV